MSLGRPFRLASLVALRRIKANWPLELAIAFGMLLAVSLMVGGVIYSSFLEEAALQRNLNDSEPVTLDVKVRTFYALGDEGHATAKRFAQERIIGQLGRYATGISDLLQTSTFYYQGVPGEGNDTTRPRGKLQYMSGLPDHVDVVAGRLPQDSGQSGPIEVALDDTGAPFIGASLGQTLALIPAVVVTEPKPIQVQVVGIYHVRDPNEEFWTSASEVFGYQSSTWAWAPMLTTEANILGPVAAAYPTLLTDESWMVYLDAPHLRAGEIGRLRAAVLGLRGDMGSRLRNGSMSTGLVEVIDRYREQVLLARVPLFLLVFLGISILLYYLFLLSTLVVRSRSEEIALLKSRGATTRQVGSVMLLEALLLAVPAVALGPFVSLLIVNTLGRALELSSATVSVVPIALSTRAFLLGAGGGALCVLTMGLSSFLVARQGIVQARQASARPPATPVLHRYYIDVLLLAVVGLLWWQVLSKGSFLVGSGQGELKLDFSLLFGPVLTLLAMGLLLLRLFPLFLRGVSWLAEAAGPIWLVHGLKRLSRDPIMPGAMVVLLVLATALGLVGGAFNSTLERSQRDRAMYQAGADMRIRLSENEVSRQVLAPGFGLTLFAGGNQAAQVMRQSGWITSTAFGTSVDVLAVDPGKFGAAAWYRGDFAGASLDGMMEDLSVEAGQGGGIVLPEGTRALGVWVRPSRPDKALQLRARIQDTQQGVFDLPLGTLDSADWQYLERDLIASLPLGVGRGATYRGRPPLVLRSLYVTRQGNWRPGAIYLDQVMASDGVTRTVIGDFTSAGAWHATDTAGQPGLVALDSSLSVGREGRPSGALTWSSTGTGLRGVRPGAEEPAVPILVSPGFLRDAQASVGDTLALRVNDVSVPVRVADVVKYFPTLDERTQPFTVAPLGPLAAYVNARTTRTPLGANEVWVHLAPSGAAPDDVTAAMRSMAISVDSVTLASEVVASRLSHPLLAAGWSGLLILTFFTVVLASASGIILYSYLDAREREREFAVLRTLGLSRRQLDGVVWLSVALLLAAGIALGTWAGGRLGTALLPLLEVAEGGRRVTPPMVLNTNWTAILWYYLVLVVAAGATALALAWLLGKRAIHQVLRIGE